MHLFDTERLDNFGVKSLSEISMCSEISRVSENSDEEPCMLAAGRIYGNIRTLCRLKGVVWVSSKFDFSQSKLVN